MRIQAILLSEGLHCHWKISGCSDCKFGHSCQELIETHCRDLLEANIPCLFLLMMDKEIFIQKTVQYTLRIQPFPPMLAWGAPGEEISTLSMQKPFFIPAFTSSPPSQGSRSEPASALTKTYLFLPLSLRAVGLWAVFGRRTPMFLLHIRCVLYILVLYLRLLAGWALDHSPRMQWPWMPAGITNTAQTSTLWESEKEIMQKKLNTKR